MVSRENAVHLVAVSLAILVLVLAAWFDVGLGSSPAAIAVFVLYNGLIFGGAHLYLAMKGEDGMIPADARWRYVGALGVVLGCGAVSLAVGDATVGPVTVNAILLLVVVLVAALYLYSASLDGYRESRPE